MLCNRGKISLRQALFLFVNFLGSPSIRFVPVYASEKAKQAAWLSPLVSLGIFLLYLIMVQNLLRRYKDSSFADIVQDILGKILGKTISLVIFVWITICVAFNLRYFCERMVSTIFTDTNIIYFAFTISVLIAYVLRSGLVVLARMNEIFFLAINAIYFLANILLIPELKPANLLPLTYKDIVPVLKSSIGATALWGYFTYLLMFADLINSKEKIKREGSHAAFFLTFLTTLVILIPLGLFGWPLVVRMPIPYYSAVKEVTTFSLFAGVESGVITIWMLTDFVLLSSLSYAALYILKMLFKSSDAKPFINIYMVIIFFMSLLICKRIFELEAFSKHIFVPVNIFMGYGVPLIVFVVGKIRKKV